LLVFEFAFSAVIRHQVLNQSVPIIGAFLSLTASLLGQSLAQPLWRSAAVDCSGTRPPLEFFGPGA